MSDLVKFLKTGDMTLINDTDTRTAITQQLLTTIDTELLMQIARNCPIQTTLTLDQLEPLLLSNSDFARCFYAQVLTNNSLVANFIQNINSTEVSGKLHVDGGTLVQSLCAQDVNINQGSSYTLSGVTGGSVNVGSVSTTTTTPAVHQACISRTAIGSGVSSMTSNGGLFGILMQYKWYILAIIVCIALGIWVINR